MIDPIDLFDDGKAAAMKHASKILEDDDYNEEYDFTDWPEVDGL